MPEDRKLREYLDKATLELRKSRRRLRRLEEKASEPIAIVGMGCRYPGDVRSPRDLWELVAAGGDAITPFPTDRGWDLESLHHPDPGHPGSCRVREGGFLLDMAGFDAAFFGIGPRDAAVIDPQQRLMLEVSWEAIEAAGLDPRSLQGSSTGVFAGGTGGSYGLLMGPKAPPGSLAGGAFLACAISGRVSYTLGLRGPAATVDTACSSSLVAIHLACQALRNEECSLALAGGVTIMATPHIFVDAGSAVGALAADGRCKAFADAADGTAFAEGVGMLALERLSDAERGGHSVLAVVRGSAVNQDGASNGLAAPNGPAQEQVIRRALADARLTAADVDVVEAHGTGTTLGDPIEAGALLATYGQRQGEPLRFGSVKSNIGHAASAAGVAGVIKMTLAMNRGVMPRTLHVDRPSTKIEWSSGAVELLTEARAWEPGDSSRRAGISSFGVSGTNAHLILEEAPAPSAGSGRSRPADDGGGAQALPGPLPLVLSAKSDPALRDAARLLWDHLDDAPEARPLDVACSAAARPLFDCRAVAVGESREELRAGLEAIAAGEGAPGTSGRARGGRRTAFLFPGYGSQWPGMGLGLLESSPVFAAALRECDEALSPYLDWRIEAVLREEDGAPPMADIAVGVPVLFATSVALAKLWRACGVEPSLVVGHSQGELVAAHVAGGLSLDDAARIAVLRLRAAQGLVGKGAMASIGLPAAELEAELGDYGGRVELAAVNGPASTVVSGDPGPLDELIARFEAQGAHVKKVAGVATASHSFQVEEIREELLELLAPISPRSSDIPFHSTVTGELLDTANLDAEYWYRNARRTVLLDPVVRGLVKAGVHNLLEVSPHPVLGVGLRETADSVPGRATVAVLGTLRRGEGGPQRFAQSLAEAHVAGVSVDWEKFFAGSDAERVELPTYPFQRERCWGEVGGGAGDVTSLGLADAGHPLLGVRIDEPGGDALQMAGRISAASHPWLSHHTVLGETVLSGTAFLDLALRAASEVGAEVVERLELDQPLVVPPAAAVQLRLSVEGPDEEGRRAFSVHSRLEAGAEGDGDWTRRASGALSAAPSGLDPRLAELAGVPWPPPDAEPRDVEALYDALAEAGFEYGESFRCLHRAWTREGEAFAEVALAEGAEDGPHFGIHPGLLASLSLALLDAGGGKAGRVGAPCAWHGVRLHAAGTSALRARLLADDDGTSLLAVDEAGAPVLTVDSVIERAVDPTQLRNARRRSLHRLEWQGRPSSAPASNAGRVGVVGAPIPALGRVAQFADLTACREALESGAPPPSAVLLSPCGTDPSEAPGEAAGSVAVSLLTVIREWLAAEPPASSRLVLLASGTVCTDPEEATDLGSSPIWGIANTAFAEHPGRFALIDSDGSEASQRALGEAVAISATEPALAIRNGELRVPRFVPVTAAEQGQPEAFVAADRTVLICGGVDGAGGAVARHLVAEHGVRHLLLLHASERDPVLLRELESELAAAGARASILRCDPAERRTLEEAIGSIPPEHPLAAVIDAELPFGGGPLESLDPTQLQEAVGARLAAAWNLHELTSDLNLERFLLFSSVLGTVGYPMQAVRATASAFLDALARHRQRQGLAATSMAWGEWLPEDSIIHQLRRVDHARIERAGLEVTSREAGLELFDGACATAEPWIAPAGFSASGLRARAEAGTLPPVLQGLVRRSRREGGPEALRARLLALSPAQRTDVLTDLVREHAALILGHPSMQAVDAEQVLQEMGFDSLGAVELRNRLIAATGVTLPMLALADRPTPAEIAAHLREALAVDAVDPSDATAPRGGEGGTLLGLLGAARQRDALADFVDLLGQASSLLPAFGEGEREGVEPSTVQLAAGEAPPLVLLTSLGPMSGTHEYVKFARCFDGGRAVHAVQAPGFSDGEPLPRDLAATTRALEEALEECTGDTGFFLGGHSSGGWLAHALVEHLEEAGGELPLALLLLDTPRPDEERLGGLMAGLLERLHEEVRTGAPLSDRRLMAMAAYRRILRGWRPGEVAIPTVLVAASAGLRAPAEQGLGGEWELSHALVETAGDHFSMLVEDAEGTARAVDLALEEKVENLRASNV